MDIRQGQNKRDCGFSPKAILTTNEINQLMAVLICSDFV